MRGILPGAGKRAAWAVNRARLLSSRLATGGGLYRVYMRGEAYLVSYQNGEAAAEFQKILDQRGMLGRM